MHLLSRKVNLSEDIDVRKASCACIAVSCDFWLYAKFSSRTGAKVCNDPEIHYGGIYSPQNMSVFWDVCLFAQNSVSSRLRLASRCRHSPPLDWYRNLW